MPLTQTENTLENQIKTLSSERVKVSYTLLIQAAKKLYRKAKDNRHKPFFYVMMKPEEATPHTPENPTGTIGYRCLSCGRVGWATTHKAPKREATPYRAGSDLSHSHGIFATVTGELVEQDCLSNP